MKKLIYFIFTISLFHQFTFGQWVQQEGGTTVTLYNLEFVNVDTGWITGTASKILKTTNGGINWITQDSPLPPNRELNDIQMFDENTGYIVGWSNTFLKTTNGGINWNQLTGPSVNYGSLNAMSFVNENTGWVCAFLGIIWRTTNGGLNWDSLNTGNSGPLRDIEFINAQTGWVVGDVGYMRKTTNGGLNWYFQFFGTFSDYYYNSLFFLNSNTGWVVGFNDKVFRTTNAGTKWDTVSNTPGICINFVNSMTGWTGGDNGDIYKTTNGGLNFYQQTIPVMGGFFTDINFVNDTVGWAIDVFVILKTTNGGGEFVGINPLSNEIPENCILHQNYPNPFNPNTTIEFEIPKVENVKLIVYDILGKEIETIMDRKLKAGKYTAIFNGDKLSSGIYFYTLIINNMKLTKKMNLIK
ncbi:MAG: T9SS type A sorting domain-containing protein [Ignavibacteria bacterium]|nr:T9SS type A sorting domain-containing protein [Ignavibacteria bacterium]